MTYPRQTDQKDGWTIDKTFLEEIEAVVTERMGEDDCPSLEQIEEVLLAVERLSAWMGEGKKV